MPRKPRMRSNWSILIVDDEFAIRESFRMLLKGYYDIYTAPGGEEALNIMKQRKFHLITLDLNMPKLSGIETLREIRKIDAEIPIIILTGYGTKQDLKEALLYGVRDIISKPFNTSKIIDLIDGILVERT
jgi:CheY-like chemotaxis protein